MQGLSFLLSLLLLLSLLSVVVLAVAVVVVVVVAVVVVVVVVVVAVLMEGRLRKPMFASACAAAIIKGLLVGYLHQSLQGLPKPNIY